MSLSALRSHWSRVCAWLGLWLAWWARRPSVQRPDMTTPAAVQRGREIPALKLPVEAQLLFLKAPAGSLRRIYAQMLALERGYPSGGGKLVVTFARGTPLKGGEAAKWTHTHLEAFPPVETLRAS